MADPATAKRDYARDHRPDCVQVIIALVVTREAIPLGYANFPGNTVDVTRVQKIVARMEARLGKANRVRVMGREMASAGRIAWLNAAGRRNVIGTAPLKLCRRPYPVRISMAEYAARPP